MIESQEKRIEDGSFEQPFIDSSMEASEAVNHPDCPPEIKERLSVVTVKYISFDNQFHEGQIVVDRELQQDVSELFDLIMSLPEEQRFPVESVVPIIKFGWEDEVSMAENNSSGFNYRPIAGQTKLSNHSYGFAIDLNPRLNPFIKGEMTQPQNGSYNTEVPGTLYSGHPIVEFMKARGWDWGGDWDDRKDYQHFEKKVY